MRTAEPQKPVGEGSRLCEPDAAPFCGRRAATRRR